MSNGGQIPTWQGATGLVETPNSPEFVSDATKTAVTRGYEGPYNICQSSVPAVGETYADLPGTVVVVGSSVKKMPGGKGQLIIHFETLYATTYEIEWVELDVALILHPRYWDGSTPDTSPAGDVPLTIYDKAAIQKWEDEENFIYKSFGLFKILDDAVNNTDIVGMVPVDTGTVVDSLLSDVITGGTMTVTNPVLIAGVSYLIYALSTNARDYAAKRLKGEEAYRYYAPVVRETSETLTLPYTDPCGLIEAPPAASNAPVQDDGSPYAWQRSAQRAIRTGPYGKWRQQKEWQGAPRIDSDFYATADPPTAEP